MFEATQKIRSLVFLVTLTRVTTISGGQEIGFTRGPLGATADLRIVLSDGLIDVVQHSRPQG